MNYIMPQYMDEKRCLTARFLAFLPVLKVLFNKWTTMHFNGFLALPKLRTFVALCATNYKLSKLVVLFFTRAARSAFTQFVTQLDESDNSFDDAVMVSETIANTNSEEILSAIEKNIKQQYYYL
jgi:hypothetical protein